MQIPSSEGYLICDPKKCAGCHTCVFACSLVHEGRSSLTTARLQIIEDRLGQYPNDLTIATCRQCKDPACLSSCPKEAIYVDKEYMNIRIIDQSKCVGCRTCVTACHHKHSRIRIHPEKKIALKCDLCKNTPFWKHESGHFACVESCPVNAIMFTRKPPLGNYGYEVNLRGEGWKKLDLPTD